MKPILMNIPHVSPVYMDHPDYDRVVKFIRETFPSACVLTLDRITNKDLMDRYERTREQLKKENLHDEKIVYHGTKHVNISSICSEGFKAELNTTSAYGRGTYFATSFGYSKSYSAPVHEEAFMFICRILTGKSTEGSYTKRCPHGYHSMVDNLKNPKIYVIPNDGAVLPEFLVRFYPKSKENFSS